MRDATLPNDTVILNSRVCSTMIWAGCGVCGGEGVGVGCEGQGQAEGSRKKVCAGKGVDWDPSVSSF